MCEIVSGERPAVGAGTGVGSASACVSAAVASGSIERNQHMQLLYKVN